MSAIPTLVTAHLTLRPLAQSDFDALFRLFSEPDILKYFPNPNPPDEARIQRILDNQARQWSEHGLGWWALVVNGEKELCGWNGLQYLPETGETEVGYMLSHRFWGRGLTTEGARAGLDHGFRNLGLKQIIGLVHPENGASQRVLLKCGMTFTGRAEYFGMEMFRYVMKSEE